MLDVWSKEGDRVLRKARGGDAPYRIRNRTGGSVHVWSDLDGLASKNAPAVKIADGETIDWRFDDWKTMREVCLALSAYPGLIHILSP
jgi:vacuolar protein sorting-associated protein 13A/C